MSTIEATARSAMKYLKPGAIVPVDVQTTAILVNALREALNASLAEQALDKKAENARELGLDYEPAPATELREQEPVAWLTEERYAEMHTSKWTPKIQQVFSKDGILESQTIQYAPQSKPVSYPLAQRTWVGLTDEEINKIRFDWLHYEERARAIEAKLKEKNT